VCYQRDSFRRAGLLKLRRQRGHLKMAGHLLQTATSASLAGSTWSALTAGALWLRDLRVGRSDRAADCIGLSRPSGAPPGFPGPIPRLRGVPWALWPLAADPWATWGGAKLIM
jgi:hypothetical protein